MTIQEDQAEIRSLAEQNRALKEVRRLQTTGQPIPKLLLQKAYGRIQFKSAGSRRVK
jgi:hypothetical protein